MIGWTGGGYGTILKTIDGGSNWITQEIGNELWVSDIFIANQDTVWVATFNGPLLHTTNGGEDWINSNITSATIFSICFADENKGTAVGYGSRIFNTFDGGLNWVQDSISLIENFTDIFFVDGNNGWMVGDFHGNLLKTTDGGSSWDLIFTFLDGMNSIYFINEYTGWAAGLYGQTFKTTDGGITWHPQLNNFFIGTLKSIFFADSLNGWTVGSNGSIWKTTNGGEDSGTIPIKPVVKFNLFY